MIKKIGFVVNSYNENAARCADEASAYLSQNGIICFYEDALKQPENKPDLILSFGGDGTFLRGAQYAYLNDIPILGIDFGRIGFLTEVLPDQLQQSLECLLRDDFSIEKRSVLAVKTEEEQWFAVNDVVISRGGYARLMPVNIQVNDQSYGRYLADGVIVATPTGSTGYSLSAGGPIISPEVDCISVTPICAHSLSHRPLVVAADACVTVRLGSDPQLSGVLQIDGQSRKTMKHEEQVTVHMAEKNIQIVRFGKRNFYDLVVDKLNEWRSI